MERAAEQPCATRQYSGLEDGDLVERSRNGQAAPFDLLMRRHYEALERFFRHREPNAAHDLTQETAIACLEALERFEGRSSFRTFLFAIARRQLAYYRREHKYSHEATSFDEHAFEPPSATTPSRFTQRREEQRLLLYGVSQLPPSLRAVFDLYYAQRKTTREIADSLGVSVTVVTTRLSRARVRLRQHIDEVRPSAYAADRVMRDLAGWTRSVRTTPEWSRALDEVG